MADSPTLPGRVPFTQRLFVRIYLALLVTLLLSSALFAIVHLRPSPTELDNNFSNFSALAGRILPPPGASVAQQQAVLQRWSERMHINLALYDAERRLIAVAGRKMAALDPAQTESGRVRGRPLMFALKLADGRWLQGQHMRSNAAAIQLIQLLAAIALVIAIGAYPVVRRMTRRLERLQASVDVWGDGQLTTRVAVEGRDEVAHLALSFNHAAARIEALVGAQKSLLANASHELRSPLARIRMAVELMQEQASPAIREELKRNVSELDQLIDEVLLASRLDAVAPDPARGEPVDLDAIVVEECARVGARWQVAPARMLGDARLLRRMVRNLLENAARYGAGTEVTVSLTPVAEGHLRLDVCDGGPGIPESERERVFEPFYRVPGASEAAGGVGLGLSLVRQIARHHGGGVQCLANEGGGCCFSVELANA